jgi:putative transposase
MLRPHLQDGLSLRAVAQDAGVPFRTAQRWVAQYHEHGLAGLARKERQDRGSRRTLSPRLLKVIEGLALERPRLPMRSISRQVSQLAELLGEAKPSYWMVCDIVRELPKG